LVMTEGESFRELFHVIAPALELPQKEIALRIVLLRRWSP
jgi:hypothetical protein